MNSKLILLGLLCVLSTFAHAQADTLDILSFTAPESYERRQSKEGVQFSRTAADGSGYCNITLYVSRASADSIPQEFINEWNEHIRKPRNVDVPAEPQTSPPNNGWSVVFGITPVKSDKGDYVVSLMTIIGHKRVTSILIVTKSDAFNGDLDTFLRTVRPLTNVADQKSQTQK